MQTTTKTDLRAPETFRAFTNGDIALLDESGQAGMFAPLREVQDLQWLLEMAPVIGLIGRAAEASDPSRLTNSRASFLADLSSTELIDAALLVDESFQVSVARKDASNLRAVWDLLRNRKQVPARFSSEEPPEITEWLAQRMVD